VIADLLREYGFIPADSEGVASLRVTWEPSFESLLVEWLSDGFTLSRREKVTVAPFEEGEESRRRRKLRLAIHNMFAGKPEALSRYGQTLSPWGTLTGVRPGKIARRFIDQGFSDNEIAALFQDEFGLEESRAWLLLRVCHNQAPFLPGSPGGGKRICLYLSYPFCPSRCEYCSFPGYEAARWRKWLEPCHKAMINEIRSVGQAATSMGFEIGTAYFGGGTPTCMPPESMDHILSAIRQSFNVAPGAEWTVEGGRPETLTGDMLDVLTSHPINRVCVNPQSMKQISLDRIGRSHSASDIEAAFIRIQDALYKAKRDDWRVNCDLILGLPGESLDDAKESLRQTIALKPDNITIHGLAIKRGSAYKENQETLPDKLLGQSMISESRIMMSQAGYLPYYLYRQKDSLAGGENVGYALPGAFCVYNILMIEERQSILGLGVGAGSKFLRPGNWLLDNVYNPKDLIQYIERVDELIKRKVDKLAELV